MTLLEKQACQCKRAYAGICMIIGVFSLMMSYSITTKHVISGSRFLSAKPAQPEQLVQNLLSGDLADAASDPSTVSHFALSELTDATPNFSPVARVYVINVASASERWEYMQSTFGSIFGQANDWLPPMQRFEAATPAKDNCELPYSLDDCCTQSHKNAMRNFSADTQAADDQWALILEDDIALHPSITPEQLGRTIATGLAKADTIFSPVVYLGLCAPECQGPETMLDTAMGANASFHAQCSGYCTHAYAIRKSAASQIPERLESMVGKARTIDAAFRMMAKEGVPMSLVGGSLSSPDKRAEGSVHTGIFYMKSFDDALTGGTWDKKTQVLFEFPKWEGRAGNLMFEWASVTALAKRAGAETKAFFDVWNYKDEVQCPAASFFHHFKLQRFSRDRADMPVIGPVCYLEFKEFGANVYEDRVVRDLMANISFAKESGKCRSIVVTVSGYLQSYKYFESLRPTISKAFAAPKETQKIAGNWLQSTRETLATRDPTASWLLVGVNVRRGDKVHDPNYQKVYAPTTWKYYQAAMGTLEKRLTANASSNVRIAFVVTAGGSMASNTEDMVETKDALGTVSDNIFFADGTDAYSDLAIMTSMDALVLSAGSFSWWSGYLSQAAHADRLVIAPHLLYQPSHPLSNAYHVDDYYPSNWDLLDGMDGRTVTRRW